MKKSWRGRGLYDERVCTGIACMLTLCAEETGGGKAGFSRSAIRHSPRLSGRSKGLSAFCFRRRSGTVGPGTSCRFQKFVRPDARGVSDVSPRRRFTGVNDHLVSICRTQAAFFMVDDDFGRDRTLGCWCPCTSRFSRRTGKRIPRKSSRSREKRTETRNFLTACCGFLLGSHGSSVKRIDRHSPGTPCSFCTDR